MGSVTHAQILRTWSELAALDKRWDSLLASSHSGSTFLTWDWIEAWRAVHGGACTPFVLVLSDERGETIGVAPFIVVRDSIPSRVVRVVRFIGDRGGDANNLDIVAKVGHEAVVMDAVLSALASSTTLWDVLELHHIPGDSPNLGALRAGALQRGWRLQEDGSPHLVIHLPETWDEFLAGLSQKSRWRMARNAGMPPREGVRRRGLRATGQHLAQIGVLTNRVCERKDELPWFIDALTTLHARRWSERGQSGMLHNSARRRFYQQLAPRLLDRKALDIDVLELDGRPIAAQFGFRYDDTYYWLQTGFDPAFARHSPSFALTGRVIHRLISAGIRYYDFLHGAESYKLRWAPTVSAYAHLTIVRPRSIGAVYVAVARAGGRARARARERFPALWTRLRRVRDRLSPARA